ncbi:LacI family DNA-binding transcriptional regulator, partial [Streptomyces spiralis]|uniref:LacI family DNA-binding transcriptional regulator n=1 Tax=Streptomyces spiralis TaxID=66376 RepID=UPI001E43BC22
MTVFQGELVGVGYGCALKEVRQAANVPTATVNCTASEMKLAERLIGQRPTLEDVARRAGVSKSTVSRVINGEPRVREAVAERIREAVAELGYVPNQA